MQTGGHVECDSGRWAVRELSRVAALLFFCAGVSRVTATRQTLTGTEPLTLQGELLAQMVAGID